MFALIDTKGANHIAIYIPAEGADKAIPALVGMLEHNAVFVNKCYSAIEQRTPEMSIQLGSAIKLDNSDVEFVVTTPENAATLDDSFVFATPEVRISYAKAIERKDSEIKRLRVDLEHVKQQLSDAQAALEARSDND